MIIIYSRNFMFTLLLNPRFPRYVFFKSFVEHKHNKRIEFLCLSSCKNVYNPFFAKPFNSFSINFVTYSFFPFECFIVIIMLVISMIISMLRRFSHFSCFLVHLPRYLNLLRKITNAANQKNHKWPTTKKNQVKIKCMRACMKTIKVYFWGGFS